MKIPDDCRFAYVISHKTWYREVIKTPSITVCASAVDGGVAWEFTVEEVDLRGAVPLIRMGLFSDSFVAFEQIPEFFAAVSQEKPTTLRAIVEILKRLDAVDETEYVRPAHR